MRTEYRKKEYFYKTNNILTYKSNSYIFHNINWSDYSNYCNKKREIRQFNMKGMYYQYFVYYCLNDFYFYTIQIS